MLEQIFGSYALAITLGLLVALAYKVRDWSR